MGDEGISKIRVFTDLDAWKEGHKLVVSIYKLTNLFPKTELFSLTNQIRRAAVSVTSNIAEGFSRPSYKDKIRFYSMSQGSLTELQNQLIVAKDIGYKAGQYEEVWLQTVKVHKILNGLIKKSKEY